MRIRFLDHDPLFPQPNHLIADKFGFRKIEANATTHGVPSPALS